MDYNATLTFTPADGVDDDELVDRLVDYHPAVGPSDLVPGAREAVITLPAASLSQAITTIRAVAASLGVLHGLEIVPTAAWDRRLGRTTNEDDLIGVTEAAGALGVTPQAVRERLAAGTLPGRKIGRCPPRRCTGETADDRRSARPPARVGRVHAGRPAGGCQLMLHRKAGR